MQRDDALVLVASIKSSHQPIIRSPFMLDLLYKSLELSDLSSQPFVVYSKRQYLKPQKLSGHHILYAPRKLVVRACEHLASVNDCVTLLDWFLDAQEYPDGLAVSMVEDWEAADSDFEDDWSRPGFQNEEEKEIGFRNLRRWRSLRKPRDHSEETVTPSNQMNVDRALAPQAVSNTPESTTNTVVESQKIIVLLDTSYRTWQALLYYLHTGIIIFSPLSSGEVFARAEFCEDYRRRNPNRPIPPSSRLTRAEETRISSFAD
ncbi:hypothetical protein BKA93DRAFT_50198 [Sparassis latifolia]